MTFLAGETLTAARLNMLSFAEYSSTALQTIATGTDTKMTWNTAVSTSTDISYSAGVFTVLRAGVFEASGTMRWAASTSTAERALVLSTSSATAYRFGGANAYGNSTSMGPQLPITGKKRFAVADVFSVWLWQGTGGNLDTSVALDANRITITRIGD